MNTDFLPLFEFVAHLLAVDLILAYLMVDGLCIKITGEVDNEFALEPKLEQIVLEIVVVDGVDGIDEFNKIDKHKEIVLL